MNRTVKSYITPVVTALYMAFVDVFVMVLIGCQSTGHIESSSKTTEKSQNHTVTDDLQEDRINYSENHIDFKKWDRTSDCCTARGKHIAIASGGTNSSKCGTEIHDKGGNIVDSAVAVAFCLAVERPHSAGIGGGGFLMLHLAHDKQHDYFLDFREKAPLLASRDMYLDNTGAVIRNLSLNGALSVATPGFVAGLYDLHKKWGKLSWQLILSPAVRLAREGFSVYPSLAEKIEARKEVLVKDPTSKKIFIPDGENSLKEGDWLIQSDLAKTIEWIGKGGKKAFYHGAIARDIVKAVKDQQGILDKKDLESYKTRFRKPLKETFNTMTVITSPPPSAGGVIMLEIMNVLKPLNLSINTPYSEYVHILSETMKRGFADRSQYIGDPDFYKDETYLSLLTPEYADHIRKSLDPLKATPSYKIRPGHFSNENESPDTTQLSLIDSDGNAVSSTITINYYFGSGITVPGRGIILNDEMDDFSTKVGEKNVYGLTGNEANKIEPGKRPVSSMTPTITLENGKPVMAIGAPGGSHIISGVTGVLLNYSLFFKNDLRQSIFAPRIHDQWIPDKLFLELKSFPAKTKQNLIDMGHVIEQPSFTSLVAAVAWDKASKEFVAVFDPRDEGGVDAR